MIVFFFFKQKTAYEMRISDWSSDVCSSDLNRSPMRPAHIHFKVEKDGFDPLITHVFAEGDEFLDSDAVFGVRGSCIGNYVRHDSGPTPFGDVLEQPFYTLDYRFTLQPVG